MAQDGERGAVRTCSIPMNPQRCQRTAVSGFTMTRALSESVQMLRNSTQNPRPFHRTAEDGELLPKSDIVESQLATSLEGRDESPNKRRNHAGMVPADRRLIKFGARG